MAGSSSTKIQYELRPAKQVERRMFVDALQELGQSGFPIREYTYVGMGSIYFVDFIMFHIYLGIDNLVTVEHDAALKTRVKFNKPFARVKVIMDRVGNVLASLNRDTRYLIWLDYDRPLTRAAGEDIRLAISSLRCGSILLASLPIFPRGGRKKEESYRYYDDEARDYFGVGWNDEEFSPNRIVKSLTYILNRIISAGLQGRPQVSFQPLFYYRYADGREMLTIGGMVCDGDDRRRIRGCEFRGRDYIRRSFKSSPFSIEVPVLTRKERAHADACMPSSTGFMKRTLGFTEDEIKAYRRIYRFLPSYGELLLG